MLEQAFDRAQRAGHDVRPDFRAIDDVHGVADTRRKDLRLEHVIVVDPRICWMSWTPSLEMSSSLPMKGLT